MPKIFYTERDIEDLAKRGVISLVLDDDIVLTDLARDKAMRLGIELLRERPPSAPERPYITKLTSPTATLPTVKAAPKQSDPAPTTAGSTASSSDALFQQVYNAVIARLGDSVDKQLLETIVRRVLHTVTSK
jgi:hypothetical protein